MPGILRKIFGGPISQSVQDKWPELATNWANREIDMPSETTATNKVRPMNWLEKYAVPGADAVTWPWGTIALNKDVMDKNKSNLGDVLTHELTHVGQGQKTGIIGNLRNTLNAPASYLARPNEQEAFGAEASRNVRRGDIQLIPEKKKLTTGPSSAKLNQLVNRSRE